jgi:hypothetical protein
MYTPIIMINAKVAIECSLSSRGMQRGVKAGECLV